MQRLFSSLYIVCLFSICSYQAHGQEESHWIWSNELSFGLMNFKPMEGNAGAGYENRLGRHLQYNMGIGYLHEWKYGFSAHFSLLSKWYVLGVNSSSYYAGSIFLSPGLRAYRLFDVPFIKSGYVNLAMEYNFAEQDDGLHTDQVGSTRVELQAFKMKKHFVTPMLGISSQRNKMIYSVSMGYQFSNNTGNLLEVTAIEKDGDFARFAGKPNALLINFNFGILLNSSKDKVQKTTQPPVDAEELEYRDEKELPVIKSDRRRVLLEIYDNGEVDNDSVTVSLNGEYILTNYRLTKSHKKIWLDLYKGQNRIVFMACNEGKNPPNTAHCRVVMGPTKRVLTVASDLETNSVLIIECE